MAEISLILSSPGANAAATAIAMAASGTGVSSLQPPVIQALLDARDQITRMMSGSPRMTSEELRQFGQSMGRALFSQDVGVTWTVAAGAAPAGAAPVITTILATSPELKAIPWEYAAWPDGQDGPQRRASVVRLVPQSRATPAAPIPIASDGFRVLMLSASPSGLAGIPWADVRDDLIRVFGAALPDIQILGDDTAPAGPRFVRIVDAATRAAVDTWIAKDDPHIVHFVGHGTDKGIALINGLKNKPTLLSASGFEQALKKAPSLRLVILSACDTANAASIDPVDASVGTLAEQLVRNAVPAVVASQTVIDKRTIATFCDGLYPELIQSGSIDLGVAAGRCEIVGALDEVDKAAIEWGIPVLYRRLGAAQLFVPAS
jgi:hypothetical protein